MKQKNWFYVPTGDGITHSLTDFNQLWCANMTWINIIIYKASIHISSVFSCPQLVSKAFQYKHWEASVLWRRNYFNSISALHWNKASSLWQKHRHSGIPQGTPHELYCRHTHTHSVLQTLTHTHCLQRCLSRALQHYCVSSLCHLYLTNTPLRPEVLLWVCLVRVHICSMSLICTLSCNSN